MLSTLPYREDFVRIVLADHYWFSCFGKNPLRNLQKLLIILDRPGSLLKSRPQASAFSRLFLPINARVLLLLPLLIQ
jgi:hypothetical protein